MATILVLDDNRSDSLIVEKVLAKQGHQCVTFSDPEKFLKEVPKLEPDLVILDIQMPKISGLQVLKTISPQFIETPVMMLTGHSEVRIVSEAIRLGAKDFCVKPLDQMLFVEKVNKLLPHLNGEKSSWHEQAIVEDGPWEMEFDLNFALLSVSEFSATIQSSVAVQPGTQIKAKVKQLSDIGIGSLFLSVDECYTSSPGEYLLKARIVGLPEKDLQKVRVLALRQAQIARAKHSN